MKDIYVLKYKSGNQYLVNIVDNDGIRDDTRFHVIGYVQVGAKKCIMSIGHRFSIYDEDQTVIERATEEQISQATLNAL